MALREPAHQVCPRAVTYWRIQGLIEFVVELVVVVVVLFVWSDRPGWVLPLALLLLAASLIVSMVVPSIRFRVHRWEVDDMAVHTRSGWLNVDSRIAPLNRVQTVDSQQGPLMRLFGLASLTVTTASAAGPVEIVGLDAQDARRLVTRLTEITGAIEGDAT